MKVIEVYEYVFYKLYRWSLRVNGKGFPAYYASGMLSLIHLFNLATIYFVMGVFQGANLPPLGGGGYTKISVVCLVVLIWMFNISYFTKNKRHQKIAERYSKESPTKAKWGATLTTAYVVGSLLLLVVTMVGGAYLKSSTYNPSL